MTEAAPQNHRNSCRVIPQKPSCDSEHPVSFSMLRSSVCTPAHPPTCTDLQHHPPTSSTHSPTSPLDSSLSEGLHVRIHRDLAVVSAELLLHTPRVERAARACGAPWSGAVRGTSAPRKGAGHLRPGTGSPLSAREGEVEESVSIARNSSF